VVAYEKDGGRHETGQRHSGEYEATSRGSRRARWTTCSLAGWLSWPPSRRTSRFLQAIGMEAVREIHDDPASLPEEPAVEAMRRLITGGPGRAAPPTSSARDAEAGPAGPARPGKPKKSKRRMGKTS
jgi:hypothetical protein